MSLKKSFFVLATMFCLSGCSQQETSLDQVRGADYFPNFLVYMAVLLGGGAVIGLFVLPLVNRHFFPKPNEQTLAEVLPFYRIVDKNILVTKDGSLHKIIQIPGIDYSGRTEDEKTLLYTNRDDFFRSLADKGVNTKIITLREKTNKEIGAHYDHPILQKIHDKWMGTFDRTFVNSTYLMVSSKGKNAVADLNDQVEAVRGMLNQYKPQVLSNEEPGQFSPLLTFLGNLVNLRPTKMPSFTDNLSERLVESSIHFGRDGLLKMSQGNEGKFGRFVSVKIWSEEDRSAIYAKILSLPGEVQICQLLRGINKLNATATKNSKLPRRQAQSKILTSNMFKESDFEAAQQLIDGNQQGLIDYQVSFLILAPTEKELAFLLEETRNIFLEYGIKPIQEGAAAEHLWFSRLPSYDKQIRPRLLLSGNLAALNNLEYQPVGLDRCDWGEGALRHFRTITGNAYSLQLHIDSGRETLAHSATFAPAGSGKTTLFQHLIGGALRHKNLSVYAFDRFLGMKIFTEAVGGDYIEFNRGSTTLNPLQAQDTPDERKFLKEWLLQLAQVDDETSVAYAAMAVETIFETPLEQRSLRIAHGGIFGSKSVLKTGISRYAGKDIVGELFNGKRDSLNLDRTRFVTFDMSDILKDERTAAALVQYIMHRIRSKCRREATPHMIFIDETAPLLQDPSFKKSVEVLFREHRKLRGSVNVVFQDVGALIGTGISETILTNCPTRFIFPNPNAQRNDYRILDLTDAEFGYVKGTLRLSRFLKHSVMIKKHNESVILDVDLSGLGDYLKIYRSGSEFVLQAERLKQAYGDQWLEKYLAA